MYSYHWILNDSTNSHMRILKDNYNYLKSKSVLKRIKSPFYSFNIYETIDFHPPFQNASAANWIFLRYILVEMVDVEFVFRNSYWTSMGRWIMYYTIHQVRMGFIRAPISDNGKSVSALTRAHICSHHHLHLYLFVQINFYLKT